MLPQPLLSSDGLRLHTVRYTPAVASPMAHALLVHGLGDHALALPYRWLAEALAAHGIACHGVDLRGHGRSEGRRSFTPSWAQLLDDLSRAGQALQASPTAQPCFLLGLSLGGLLALQLAAAQPGRWRGVVALAPALDLGGAPRALRLLLPLLSRLVPAMTLDPGLDLEALSRDREAAARYTGDALFRRRTTPRLAHEALRGMVAAQRLGRLATPLLLLHGEADRVVPPAGSARWFAAHAGPDATHQQRPGAQHNLLLESDRAAVQALIAGWMRSRC